MVGTVTSASLAALRDNLADPGFGGRRYLAGDARHALLSFVADADQRGNEVYAALYEINDRELIEALKMLGDRGHVLIGNGGGTGPGVAAELTKAHLEVLHRDLSHKGESSPSVHNKFVVEVSAATKAAARVLTGSTNWTVTHRLAQLLTLGIRPQR